jgi:HSP20 family protein
VARIFFERLDPGDDPRRLLDWLHDGGATAGAAIEFTPPVDVIETTGSVEIIADLPGVAADTLRVVFGGGTLVISGSKTPKACREHEVTFHLAERSFGTFARAVRLSGAFDAGRTTATLRAGELHVVLPRIAERRGRDLRIDVTIE